MSIKEDVKRERKELKRLEKFSRFTSGRSDFSSIDDIRGIAAKGGSLSTDELGALLESGGLSSISEENIEGAKKSNEESNPRKKTRKIGVSRRGSRKGRAATRRE